MNKVISDWTWFGPDITGWNYPPKVKEIKGFEESLKEIIPVKLREIRLRTQKINSWCRKAYKIVDLNTIPGTLEEEFWTLYVACIESEILVMEKWVNYWLTLWRMVNAESLPFNLPKGKLSDRDIELARKADWDRLLPNLRSFGHMKSGLCPFHEEKSPSFYVYEDGHYHCFGCGVHGNPIDYVMQKENKDFISAVKELIWTK